MKLLSRGLTVVGIGMLIGMLYAAGRLSGWDIPVAVGIYCLAWGIQLPVHELGHWFGGVCSGYRLLALQLGILGIEKTPQGRFRLFRAGGMAGQCIMIPKNLEKLRFRAYNLGGMAANLLLLLPACCLLLTPWFHGQLLFASLLWAAVQKVLVNGIPALSGGYPNDGYVLWLLGKYPAARKDYGMYLQLYEKLDRQAPIQREDFTYAPGSAEPEALLYYRELQELLHSVPASAEV